MSCSTCRFTKGIVDPQQLSLKYEAYAGILSQMKAYSYSNISWHRETYEFYKTILELLKL